MKNYRQKDVSRSPEREPRLRTRRCRNLFNVMEATMARDPDASELGLLKDYFAALADHDPAQEGQPVEAIFDQQIRRRFGDWIARSVRNSNNRKAKTVT